MNEQLIEWIKSGERGISSNTIVEIMEGHPLGYLSNNTFGSNHPHDPSDFFRCSKLLEKVPEYKARMGEMKRVSVEWLILVDHWEELEKLLAEELPTGKAPKLYARMSELLTSIDSW